MPSVDDQARATVERLEDELQDALMGPDLEWFERSWTDDAVYVHMSGGFDDRAQFIDRLRSRKTVYHARELGDVKMRQYGPTVIVTGWSKIDIDVSGEPRHVDSRFTRVYVRDGDDWRLASNQSGGNTAATK